MNVLFARIGMELSLTDEELEIIKNQDRSNLVEIKKVVENIFREGRMKLDEDSCIPNASEQLGNSDLKYEEDELFLG